MVFFAFKSLYSTTCCLDLCHIVHLILTYIHYTLLLYMFLSIAKYFTSHSTPNHDGILERTVVENLRD
jgi:hypothetical protein